MPTSAAIAPLPAMPMSMDLVFQYAVATAARTPPAAAMFVVRTTSGKRPSSAPSVEPGVKPDRAEPQDEDAQAEQRHVVAGDRPRLAVGAVLALARSEVQEHRQGARRTDEVNGRRAG